MAQGRSNIHVRFNQPMIALQDAAAMNAAAAGLLTISPPLPGQLSWQTPDLLLFEPEGDLPDAQRFTVTLHGPITSPTGATFNDPLSWTFETTRPTLAWSIPEDRVRLAPPRTPVALIFSHALKPAALRPHLTVTAHRLDADPSTARPAPFSLRPMRKDEFKDHYRSWGMDSAHTVVIDPGKGWPLDSHVQIDLKAGVLTSAGPLPTDAPWSLGLDTYPPLSLASKECDLESPCQSLSLTLTFSTPIPERQARLITVSPPPPGLDVTTQYYDGEDAQNASTEVTIQALFEPDKPYTLSIPAALTDAFGQRLGRKIDHAFKIAHPEPLLALSATGGILQATRPPTVGVDSRHVAALRVRAVAVDPDALRHAFNQGLDPLDVAHLPFPDGDPSLVERRIALTPRGKTHWSSLPIDLAELTGRPTGPVLIEIEQEGMVSGFSPDGLDVQRGLLQMTDLGVEWVTSHKRSLLRVVRLSTGLPVQGAAVDQWWPSSPPVRLGTTDADGLIDAPGDAAWPSPSRRTTLHVHTDADQLVAWLDAPRTYTSTPQIPGMKPDERLIGRLITERGVYRPGEPVHFVGWTGLDTPHEDAGLAWMPAGTPVQLALLDRDGREVQTQDAALTAQGKLHGMFTLPEEAGLGQWGIRARIGGTSGPSLDAPVKVRQFRTPEFRVDVTADLPHATYDDTVKILTAADYYFGGPVHFTQQRTSPSCHPISWRPDNLGPRWQLGLQPPHHYGWGHGRISTSHAPDPATPGRSCVNIPGSIAASPYTNRCAVYVTVQDASLQEVVGETSLTVHPARHYLAVETPTHAIEAQSFDLPIRAVDLEGRPIALPGAQARVSRTWWEPNRVTKGERVLIMGWVEKTEVVTNCRLDLKANTVDQADGVDRADGVCSIKAPKEGSYTVEITARGSKARTEAHFHVAPKYWARWLTGPSEQLEIHLGPKEAEVGQPLTVVVRAPQLSGRGVLLIERAGLRQRLPFNLDKGSASFTLPVPEAWVPEMHFQAHLLAIHKDDPPTLQTASATLKVKPDHRRLQVSVKAPAIASPGQDVQVTVSVSQAADASNKAGASPVGGRVTLWATDEAILSLTDYSVPDLAAAFLPSRGPDTQTQHLYGDIIKPFVPTLDDWGGYGYGMAGMGAMGYGAGGGGMGMGSVGGAAASSPARKNFLTTPLFLGDAAVDPTTGQATATIRLPDNLTTFRILAVASAAINGHQAPGRFGVGESLMQVQAPLVVRAALPNGLRPGDAAQLAAVVNNTHGPAGRLTVSLTIANGVAPADGVDRADGVSDGVSDPGRRRLGVDHVITASSALQAVVRVEAGGQARVPFEIKAARVGVARLTLRAILTPDDDSPPAEDAVELPLEIAPEPTLIEHVAVYGELADDIPVAIPIKLPGAVLPQFGGVSISADSTLLGGLQDAVHQLVHYPYGCAEQTSSRLLPLVALSELSRAWPLGIGDPSALVRVGIKRLLSMQTADGGFAYWPGGESSHAYVSAYVTWILQLAAEADHPVPQAELERAYAYLQAVTEAPDRDWDEDTLFGHDLRRAIAVYTLSRVGRHAPKALDALAARRDLPVFARAFVLMALKAQDPADPRVEQLADLLLDHVTELPETAHVIERLFYGFEGVFHSDTRSTALLLMAVMEARPDHPLIGKLARGLMKQRQGGAWRNTQENAYAVTAMAAYARTREAQTPDFTARAWAEDLPLLTAAFKGRKLDAATSGTLPMSALREIADARARDAAPLAMTIHKDGPGRLYYRLGMSYAPADPGALPPIARGLVVTRALRTEQGLLGLDAALEAGQIVAMDLTIESRTPTHYVVLDAPIPAGLDPINLDLGKGGRASLPVSGTQGAWINHQELRNDRALLFADALPAGTHRHTVFLRATTPGRFSLPPAKAEQMYAPEVFGRTDGRAVAIKAP